MTIKIDRFDVIELKNPTNVELGNMTTMLIKDRKNGNIISFIQLCNDKKQNEELAEDIIGTIETFILVNGDESED